MLVIGLANAYEIGAPKEACGDMTPKHEVENKAKDNQTIDIVPHQACYKAKSKIMVKVTAPGIEIEGVLAMAKKSGDDTNNTVGTWLNEGSKLKTLDCSDIPGSALTHSAELETYGPVGLVWQAPEGFTDPVKFLLTVVYHKDEFWIGRESEELVYDENCVDKNYEIPKYVDKDGKPRDGVASITAMSVMSMLIISLLAALL